MTRLPRAASASASGMCIRCESSSPCRRITVGPRPAHAALSCRAAGGGQRRGAAAEIGVCEPLSIQLEERHGWERTTRAARPTAAR